MIRLVLSNLFLVLCAIFLNSCFLLQLIPEKNIPAQMPNGKELQSLLIRPDVSLSRQIEVSDEKSVFVSATGIFFQENSDFFPIVVSGYPTFVGLSPDNKHLCFIEPSDFEQLSDLYVFDLEAKALRRLTSNLDGKNRVMSAAWFDANEIIFIEGYALGTQAKGGILYSFNSNGENRKRIYPEIESESRIETFEITPEKFLRLKVISESDKKIIYIDTTGNVVSNKK